METMETSLRAQTQPGAERALAKREPYLYIMYMSEISPDSDPSRSVAQAREEFPSLLEAAESGTETLITRRGRPVAIIGPVSLRRGRERTSLDSLIGSGAGLWGDARGHVQEQRDEW